MPFFLKKNGISMVFAIYSNRKTALVDESGGKHQHYVEDCQVCCKPNELNICWNSAAEEFVIEAQLES